MAQHCCVEFSVVYLIMLIKNNILSISSGEMYSVWLSPQALEFRAPFFPHLVPPEIMVWIFVWKYIFEPFIHILQHFVLQLSRSTNFCFQVQLPFYLKKHILPDKDPYHNRGRDQMRKKGGRNSSACGCHQLETITNFPLFYKTYCSCFPLYMF